MVITIPVGANSIYLVIYMGVPSYKYIDYDDVTFEAVFQILMRLSFLIRSQQNAGITILTIRSLSPTSNLQVGGRVRLSGQSSPLILILTRSVLQGLIMSITQLALIIISIWSLR